MPLQSQNNNNYISLFDVVVDFGSLAVKVRGFLDDRD